jgi:hypothetical protein
MTADYTKLLEKLVPSSDGEPVLTLRTATVDTVNADGTVDLELGSGVIVPNVPCLDNVTTAAGLVVQVLSARGSLLVIGGSSKGGQKGFIFRDERSSPVPATPTITTTETVIQVHSFLAAAGVQYKVTGIQSVQSSTAGLTCQVRLRWQTGPTLTAAGTEIDCKLGGSHTANVGLNVPLFGVFTPTDSGQVTVGATLVNNGSGSWQSFGAATQKDVIAVEAA